MESVLILAVTALCIGFFLVFLLALADKKTRKKEGTKSTPTSFTPLQFEKACVQVLEAMKLEIEEISKSVGDEIDILARNPTPFVGGQILTRGYYVASDQVISSAQIMEFSNTVLQERISKGILITTGLFTDEISTIGELAPLEYINGTTLKELIEKYKIGLGEN